MLWTFVLEGVTFSHSSVGLHAAPSLPTLGVLSLVNSYTFS